MARKSPSGRTLVVILVALIALLGSSPLAAQDAGTPAAEESPQAPVEIVVRGEGQGDGERITVEIAPGEQATHTVYIGNLGADPLAVFTFTADIGTRINGGLAIGQEGAEQHEPTTWMTYPTEHYELDPGMEIAREFSIAVPASTAPGEYVIPIAVETVDSYSVPGSEMIRQKIRKIIAVYVVVPGDSEPGFTLGEPGIEIIDRGAAIQVPITNTGRTTLRLSGTLTLKDADGGVLIDTPILMGAFYGGHETIVQTRLQGMLPPGDYLLSLELEDDASGTRDGFEDRPVTMPELEADTAPLDFGEVVVLPNAEPIQFASVLVEIANTGEVHRSTRLTLVVTHDGQPLEDFVLAENMTLEQGVTTISQRYLPLDGWEPGTYAFSLRLDAVDSGTGGTAELLSLDEAATLEVP